MLFDEDTHSLWGMNCFIIKIRWSSRRLYQDYDYHTEQANTGSFKCPLSLCCGWEKTLKLTSLLHTSKHRQRKTRRSLHERVLTGDNLYDHTQKTWRQIGRKLTSAVVNSHRGPTAPLGSSRSHHIGAAWVSQLCAADTLWQRGGDAGAFKVNWGFMRHLSEEVAPN